MLVPRRQRQGRSLYHERVRSCGHDSNTGQQLADHPHGLIAVRAVGHCLGWHRKLRRCQQPAWRQIVRNQIKRYLASKSLVAEDTLPGLPSLRPALSITDAPRLDLCFATGRRYWVCTYWARRDVPSWHLRSVTGT